MLTKTRQRVRPATVLAWVVLAGIIIAAVATGVSINIRITTGFGS